MYVWNVPLDHATCHIFPSIPLRYMHSHTDTHPETEMHACMDSPEFCLSSFFRPQDCQVSIPKSCFIIMLVASEAILGMGQQEITATCRRLK